MSQCQTCGIEYDFARDADGTQYRNLCRCEVDLPCAQCRRGKATHVILNRSQEIAYAACAKHGVDDTLTAPAPVVVEPTPKEAKRIIKDKAEERSSWASDTPYRAACPKCQVQALTTLEQIFCPKCGAAMSRTNGPPVDMDICTTKGPKGVSIIVSALIEGPLTQPIQVTLFT